MRASGKLFRRRPSLRRACARWLAPLSTTLFLACNVPHDLVELSEVRDGIETHSGRPHHTAKASPDVKGWIGKPFLDPAASRARIGRKFNEALLDPTNAKETAPESFRARFQTTKGDFVVEVQREWAPLGADRFYNLVKLGFFDDVAFFRAISGFMVQFGIHGAGKVNEVWNKAKFSDDPVVQSNTRGMLTFATAGPNTRTTQLFINFGNNVRLDRMGFAPFGKVVEGMDIVDQLYTGYGEGAPRGRGPSQGRMQAEGNEYLRVNFPKLDYVEFAKIEGEASERLPPTPADQAQVAGKAFPDALLDPKKANLTAPDEFIVEFETTAGNFEVTVHRGWAPKGVDRFYNLIHYGYYDDVAFFRVIRNFVAQFGIHGAPQINEVWREARIDDDPVTQSNTRGTLTFAMAGPNTRTTQIFINFRDNKNLDSMKFAPFATITSGIEVIDKIYNGYGEGAPRGRGPHQGKMQFEGNDYLRKGFPKLDFIKRARVKRVVK